MKILNVNMSIDPIAGGGTAERTTQMSKSLRDLGYDCSILTLDLGITESRRAELSHIKIVALPCFIKRFYIPRPKLKVIASAVKNADIIHLMGHWTILNALVYFYINKYKKKYVVCPAGALPLFGRSRFLKIIYNSLIGKKIIQNADAHIIIAQDEASQFSAYQVSSDKLTWIPNGIDPTSLHSKNDQAFRDKYNLDSSPFILYIGRLNPIKGPDLLVEAFCSLKNQFPNHHLVMAGPDEGMLSQLRKIVIQNKIEERVHFIGHISGLDKSQALHAATLMVIPSRQEAMSIVVLEAGAVGLPVLLTDQCGLNYLESISAGVVTAASVDGLREGLINILSDQNKLSTIGSNLKNHVYENYLWSSVISKLTLLYNNILKNP